MLVNSWPLYRSSFEWKLLAVIAALIGSGCVLDAVLSTDLASWLFDGGLIGLMLGMLAWGSRLGLRVDRDGVRIINMRSRPRLRWDEIDRFELAPAGIYPFVGWVVLKEGRKIAITAIQVSRIWKQRSLRSAQATIDALNKLV